MLIEGHSQVIPRRHRGDEGRLWGIGFCNKTNEMNIITYMIYNAAIDKYDYAVNKGCNINRVRYVC